MLAAALGVTRLQVGPSICSWMDSSAFARRLLLANDDTMVPPQNLRRTYAPV